MYMYQNLLALGSEDRTLTISNAKGDTLKQVCVRTVHYPHGHCNMHKLSELGQKIVVAHLNLTGQCQSTTLTHFMLSYFGYL